MTFFRLSKATLLAAALVAAAAPHAIAQTVNLRISTESFLDGQAERFNAAFRDALKEKLGDEVSVDYFHSGTLGSEQVHLDMVRGGQIDVYGLGSEVMALEEKAGFFEMPFLIRDAEAAERILDDPAIRDEFFTSFRQKTGLQPLSIGTYGFRHFSSSIKPIVVPEDVRGMKMRVPGSSLRLQTWRFYGASPVTISSGELYVALANKTADGQEQSLTSMSTRSLQEVQQYLSLSNYLYGPVMLVMNGAKYDSLNDEQRQAVNEAAVEASKINRAGEVKAEQATLEEFRKVMEVNEVDHDAWVNFSRPLWDQIIEASPEKEFLRKVIDLATSN